MEARKQLGSSSSSSTSSSSSSSSSSSTSFASELFGSKDTYPSSSSAGIFGSIFAPSSKAFGRESLRPEVTGKKQDVSEIWNSKLGTPDNISWSADGKSQIMRNGDLSSIFQEERGQPPCHLSSSIYYGGPDIYSNPQNSQSSAAHTTFKKDGGEDDTGSASRGNWWQESLYY